MSRPPCRPRTSAFETGPWPRMKASERSAILLKAADLIEGAARGDRPSRRAGIRQADRPGARRDRRRGRHLALCRLACAHAARRILRQSRRRHAGRRAARADRRRVDHHAVEFPVPDRQPEAALRARRRLHGGGQAERNDVGLDASCSATFCCEAGVPAGVVNVLAGLGADVGAPMVSHPLVEMVSFTGSTRVGKMTMATAAQIAEESLDGTRRQERPDRLSRMPISRPRPTPRCSAASSMPANAAMPAAG